MPPFPQTKRSIHLPLYACITTSHTLLRSLHISDTWTSSLLHSTFIARLCALVDMTPSSPSSTLGASSTPNANRSNPSPDSTPPTSQQASKPPSTLYPSPAITERPKRRRLRQPAKGSILHLLRQTPGTALFVRPLCWTDSHIKLLGAEFQELAPCDTPLPCTMPGSPPTQGHLRPSRSIMVLSEALTEILFPSGMYHARTAHPIQTTLAMLWPSVFERPRYAPEMNMFFADRVYRDSVRMQIMWDFPGDSPKSTPCSFQSEATRLADSHGLSSSPAVHNPANLPMMCYVSKTQLASVRRNLFRVPLHPLRVPNEPVFRLQYLRTKAFIPANPKEDSHFVAIFLAMAQRHFYGAPMPSPRRESQWSPRSGRLPHPDFQDLKLRILTHDSETAEFLVYTGHVKAAFLERFHAPHKVPKSDSGDLEVPGIKIEFTRVPIWPILGLRERLGKALGEDIVGKFDPDVMETWEDDEEPVPTSNKRKRDALAEAFNRSFEEDPKDDDSGHGEKKRCMDGGGRLGVVV